MWSELTIPFVMAGLDTASRVYPTCGTFYGATPASRSCGAIHVFSSANKKTWTPGTSPGVTSGGEV